MSIELSAMTEAAKLAQSDEATRGGRTVYILLGPNGFVVNGRVKRGRVDFAHTAELNWREFAGRPDLLTTSVKLCVDKLRRAEEGNENG